MEKGSGAGFWAALMVLGVSKVKLNMRSRKGPFLRPQVLCFGSGISSGFWGIAPVISVVMCECARYFDLY